MIEYQEINFVDQIERQEREISHKVVMRKNYQLWLKTPDIYYVPDHEREMMKTYPHETCCNIYGQTIHVCDENKSEWKIWLNAVACADDGGEYWVKSKGIEGKNIKVCPFCGAKLSKGEGKIALTKAKRESYYAEKSVRKYYGLDELS